MRLHQPTPELPVANVAAAQQHYRDHFGFEIGWLNPEGGIGAVAHGGCAIFLREGPAVIHPVTLWIFTEDVDGAHDALLQLGAVITDPLADKPWGLRQFTAKDLNGHILHFHHG